MELLRVEHLSKIYGAGENQVKALDDVSLSVEKGEFVAIVGASGSGKSMGITEEMYQELERLVADAKPASRHLTGLAISLSTTGNIFAGAGCYHGDALTVYPYTPEAIIVGGDYFPASAIHLIDNLRVNA